MITYKDLGHKGRLGNCLFEAAATIALAKRNDDSFGFPLWEQSKFFNIPANAFHQDLKISKAYTEPHFHYKEIPYQPNLNLYGYFQSEKYFADCKPFIRTLLTPKISAVEFFPNTVSLHVRRGDYLKLNKAFNILSMDYYRKALDYVGAKTVMVFSDDIEWCRKNFIGNEFMFLSNNSPTSDLSLMMSCAHNIIANSSFSWWGAWLNKNPDKKIVAPSNWFGPELAPTHDTRDLIPEEWKII